MKHIKLHRFVISLALATACILVGAAIPTTNQAHGEITGRAEGQAFQTGSVPLLREISATLRQMDARLARLEVTAQKLQASAAASARRAASAEPVENNN
jgi:hypothetical protein